MQNHPPQPSDETSASDGSNSNDQDLAKDDSAAASDPNADNPMVNPTRSIRPLGIEAGKRLAAAAAQVALDNKGQEVMVLDVTAQSAEFDFFVLATGQSRRQLHAISEQIDDALEKELGDRRMGIEGYAESRWIVLDYGNLVVHLFDDETREYYDLESLWADAKPVSLEELGVKDPSGNEGTVPE